MYTSGTDWPTGQAARTALVYLWVSLFCALFGTVYEIFSHEVYSFYMIYAFVVPLAGGALPFLMLSVLRAKRHPGAVSRNLYHSGIATLTVGSVIRGVLEIYGTTSSLARFYWPVGAALLAAGIAVFVLRGAGRRG